VSTELGKEISKKDVYLTIGKKISVARRSSRKKIIGVSKKLNISVNHLNYIEKGEIELLPNSIPLKGFVRSLAKFLKVDISEELKQLDDLDESSKKQAIPRMVNNPLPSKLLVFFMTSFCFLLLAIYFLSINKDVSINKDERKIDEIRIENSTFNEPEDETYVLENKKFVGDNLNDLVVVKDDDWDINKGEKNDFVQQELLPKNENKEFVELIFFEETWIQIFNHNNILVDSGLFGSGEAILLEFNKNNYDYIIDTGNLGGFKIAIGKEVFLPLGRSGEVRKKMSILAQLKKLKEKEF
tara:strand:+ start:783 stop:1676 length:894 start_codon:yes stop_codon:yes gene_type:complete